MKKSLSLLLCLSLLLSALSGLSLSASAAASYYGDLDGNGSVSTADVRSILIAIVTNQPFTYQMKVVGDVNRSGAVNSADARRILGDVLNNRLEPLPEYATDNMPLPMSGFQDITNENGIAARLMIPEYTDSYTFTCSTATKLVVQREDGTDVASGVKSVTASVTEGERYVVGVKASANAKTVVQAKANNHLVRLPYDLGEPMDTSGISTSSVMGNPLKAATVNYQKRAGGTYIYCNNPEQVPENMVNQAYMRDELSGEVYMTFEHANYSNDVFYLGYQLKNNGSEDIYVTVQNIGYQAGGTWYGQLAWYDFYNTSFKLPDDYFPNGSTTDRYEDFNYSYRNYTPRVFQPITYRLPAGEYFYVIGGTSADAYQNINVDNSANKSLGKVRCANGNVKFLVTGGSVTGTMYCYRNASVVKAAPEAKGYRTGRFAAQYLGTADHAGVIDNYMQWTFNDSTAAGTLPVTYTNYYDDNLKASTSPYTAYNSTPHTTTNATQWVTHINPQSNHAAVGTDMVAFNCVDDYGRRVTVDNDHSDGAGDPANTANWMIEYQDHFTLVNKGSRARTITFKLKDNGSLAMLARDKDGNVLEARLTAGQPKDLTVSYTYSITVPAHSVEQLTLDYVLVACSYGTVTHKVTIA
ncbi:MAG: hypothetical protein IJU16_07020 [Clostridia bacterium]|nr:hypothetical protein [Clostridia bacterium]